MLSHSRVLSLWSFHVRIQSWLPQTCSKEASQIPKSSSHKDTELRPQEPCSLAFKTKISPASNFSFRYNPAQSLTHAELVGKAVI